jgi:hypothetical protein
LHFPAGKVELFGGFDIAPQRDGNAGRGIGEDQQRIGSDAELDGGADGVPKCDASKTNPPLQRKAVSVRNSCQLAVKEVSNAP